MANRLSILRAVPREQSGVFLVWFALMFTVFFGFAALAVDVGAAFWTKRDLQSTVDAAALAGASALPCLDNVNPPSGYSCTVTAQTLAKQYLTKNKSSSSANWNPAQFSFDYGCMPNGVSDKTSCAPRFDYFQVNDTSVRSDNVFSQVVGGPDHFSPHAMAATCHPCATDHISFDVMVVLDRSGSMCQNDAGAQFPNCNSLTQQPPSDLANAKNGILTFLNFFNPDPDSFGSFDRVGFVVVPGFRDSSPVTNPSKPTYAGPASAYSSNYCASGTANSAAYPGNPTAGRDGNFLIVPLRPTATTLDDTWRWTLPNGSANNTSRLVSAIKCIPGEGGTVMNEAAKAADLELKLYGRTCANCRRIVVYFGDGGGNQYNTWPATGLDASQALNGPFDISNPCGSTIANIGASPLDQDARHGPQGWGGRSSYAQSSGIEWYSIGYDVSSDPMGQAGQRCTSPTSRTATPETYNNGNMGASGQLSSQDAIRLLATNDSHFYNQPSAGSVYDIFNQIGHTITDGALQIVK